MHLTLGPGRTARKAAAHARSASQPSKHSHLALARLDGAVHALWSWSASGLSSASEGLARVEAALVALNELLATPRAAAALRGADDDRIFDAFLALADAYGTLGTALLTVRQSAAEARAGLRRGDAAVVAASSRAHRRTAKDMCRLAATMRRATAPSRPAEDAADEDTEVVDMVAQVADAAAEASGAVILRWWAGMSPDVSAIVQTVSPHNKWLTRLGVVPDERNAMTPETAAAALERLEELEERISGLESGSEKVFRRLLQTRVSLLNIHNPL
jgi:BMFP domain-containing protein YqiC